MSYVIQSKTHPPFGGGKSPDEPLHAPTNRLGGSPTLPGLSIDWVRLLTLA